MNYKDKVDEFIKWFFSLKKENQYLKKEDFNFDYYKKIASVYKDNKTFLDLIDNIDKHLDQINEDFVSFKLKEDEEYLDTILDKIDPNIDLDYDQRKIVIAQDWNSLIIACAGSGKTTTICSKIKYLVDVCGVFESDILLLSFTNNTVNELKYKINNKLKINCDISTFHSLGMRIIGKKNVYPDLYNFVLKYFNNNFNQELNNKMILFMGLYFDDFTTFKTEVEKHQMKSNEHTYSLRGEYFINYDYCRIANFLYINNLNYCFRKDHEKYASLFTVYQNSNSIYIEFVNTTDSFKNPLYSKKDILKIKSNLKKIITFHKKKNHNFIIIYNQSNYLKDLELKLIENNFILTERKDIYKDLLNINITNYFQKFASLISRFIENFKLNNYDLDKFDYFSKRTTNPRNLLFLEITKKIYQEYSEYLQSNNSIDFQDMINNAIKIINENIFCKLSYKYIIVDEFQDISKQRFELIKAISEKCKSRVIAVGDDWQSIYSFCGSNIKLFTKFSDYFENSKLFFIRKTYRNSQQLINIAGNFILKTGSHIKKELSSDKNLLNPLCFINYKNEFIDDNKTLLNLEKEKALKKAVEKIIEEYGLNLNVLIIGRYNFDLNFIGFYFEKNDEKVLYKKNPNLKISFLTAHSSKGLTFDNVIICNCENKTFGFPSKIETDPLLQFVTNYDLNEERRLWYGAQL